MLYCDNGNLKEIEKLIDTAREMGSYDDFDRGAEEYIKRFKEQK